MYEIRVKVESNKVNIIEQKIPITTNSLNTIKCVFDLPPEYEGVSCVAVFTCIDKAYKQMIIDNKCIIPKDVLQFGTFIKLGVYAFKGKELIYSPETTSFEVVEGSYEEENAEETEQVQNAFDKWIEQAKELYLKIEKASKDFETKASKLEESSANIYFWDRKSSSDNLENLKLWQNVYDDVKKGRTAFVFLNDNRIYWFEISDISITGKVDAIGRDFGVTLAESVSNLVRYNTFVNLTIENDIVITSGAFNATANNMMTFLDTNTDYRTPYEPKYAGSPATRDYVDRAIEKLKLELNI